jgi:KDO2-lipid IV(A) lauroyltransferase
MSPAAKLTSSQLESIRESRQGRIDRARRLGLGKRIAYRFHAALGFVLIGILRLMSVDRASALADWVGRSFFARRPTAKVVRTMRVPFPDIGPSELDRLNTEMMGNVLRVLAEMAHLQDFAGAGHSRFQIEGAENIEAAQTGNRGVLFLAGHFANWEMPEVVLRNMGIDGVMSVMPPTNPHTFGWIARQRYLAGFSEQVGAGEGVYRTFLRRLRQGKAALAFVDQRVSNGIKVPFFGVETSTNVIPARVAGKLGVAIVPMSVRRIAGSRVGFKVRFLPPLEYVSTGNATADDREFMIRINRFYEDEVRAVPGQWLWGHPRWDDALFGIEPKRAHRAASAATGA